jgi:hypothetical protein
MRAYTEHGGVCLRQHPQSCGFDRRGSLSQPLGSGLNKGELPRRKGVRPAGGKG